MPEEILVIGERVTSSQIWAIRTVRNVSQPHTGCRPNRQGRYLPYIPYYPLGTGTRTLLVGLYLAAELRDYQIAARITPPVHDLLMQLTLRGPLK